MRYFKVSPDVMRRILKKQARKDALYGPGASKLARPEPFPADLTTNTPKTRLEAARKRREARLLKRSELFGDRPAQSRKQLVKKLDSMFSIYIRMRDKRKMGGLCVFGCGRPIQCAFHFVTRAKYATRWDFDNAVGSCFAQNYENEFNPHPFIQWFIKNRGIKAYDELLGRSSKTAKFSIQELGILLESIKLRLKDISKIP